MNRYARLLPIVGLMMFYGSNAQAGLYSDDLARCLVESTSADDKFSLVRWMFSAASLHPAVGPIASVTEEQLDETNKVTAELFVRLLTQSCRTQVQKAMQYEGPIAIQLGFQVLGQVAAAELFSSPEVTAGMAGLEKHMDGEKLKAALEEKPAPTAE